MMAGCRRAPAQSAIRYHPEDPFRQGLRSRTATDKERVPEDNHEVRDRTRSTSWDQTLSSVADFEIASIEVCLSP